MRKPQKEKSRWKLSSQNHRQPLSAIKKKREKKWCFSFLLLYDFHVPMKTTWINQGKEKGEIWVTPTLWYKYLLLPSHYFPKCKGTNRKQSLTSENEERREYFFWVLLTVLKLFMQCLNCHVFQLTKKNLKKRDIFVEDRTIIPNVILLFIIF